MSRESCEVQTAVLETTWGRVIVQVSAAGVVACELPVLAGPPANPLRITRVQLPKKSTALARRALRAAREMLAGKPVADMPPVDPVVFERASAFRRKIWRAMAAIPRGQTRTYGELARRAGHPGAARAAGGACGANPAPLFLPCHRVLGVDGRLGGFSSGLAWKTHLLNAEGARP
ncbi:MAG: methylated-DNA--[protein]-cysteine S-methyltransferase [Kiritimatiellia bacterium]|jgi:O-6-methylguanine DNA methyltransferase